ncbi:MAG: PQQ-binding-like beta-propeller repeat protein, partial [Sedimentisphaerales bacterium]|nr:PQQ-binding-like beta-propeller repeat protein [Sedimentisphaerales bacterium]
MAASKKKPFVFFFLAIVVVSVFMFVLEWQKRRVPSLTVAANKGIGSLFTLDGRLVAVYQDGRTCAWDWNVPEIKQADFVAGSGRAIPLTESSFAAISRNEDRRLLSIYDLNTGKKIKDLTAGWEDQDIYLQNSNGYTMPIVVRRNPERDNTVEYEFVVVNLDAELLRPPVTVKLDAKTQTLRDYAVSDAGMLYAVGADNEKARLLAVDLNTGQTLWSQRWADTKELTTVTVSVDRQTVWVGDRDGQLLAVAAADGHLLKKVSLLKPGEKRTVSNDYSVLNLVVSSDGRRLGCTIAPIAYVADAETGDVTHRFSG